MPGAAFLHGDRLALHAVAADDVGFLDEHWNHPDLRQGFARYEPRRPADFAAFLDDEDTVHFLVCRHGDGDAADGEPADEDPTPVGFLWLFNVDDVYGRAEVGYWIRPANHGRGYATEAAELAVDYAFRERGLHRLQARAFETNEGSQRVLENVGFEREGALRDHYFVDGERVDAHVFGLLADD